MAKMLWITSIRDCPSTSVRDKLLTEDGSGLADMLPAFPKDNKTLGLPCKIFVNVGLRYLFNHVWLFMDEQSLAKLSAL